MCSYMRILPDENAEEKIELAERLIRESTEKENYTYSATQEICYTYMKQNNLEKAKEYANTLPIYYITQSYVRHMYWYRTKSTLLGGFFFV